MNRPPEHLLQKNPKFEYITVDFLSEFSACQRAATLFFSATLIHYGKSRKPGRWHVLGRADSGGLLALGELLQ
ncbi:MAG: hypothetical protein AAB403_22485, partial [Planctomycetota bacterium]